jgi:ABC-type dipeptide/oligopeptide/nickel transport system permease subunit
MSVAMAMPRWGRIGAALLALILVACVASLPWSAGAVTSRGGSVPRYAAGNLDCALLAPGARVAPHDAAYVPSTILGTDRLGRDMLARVLVGGSVSMLVGLSAATIAVVVGTLWGAASGWLGGRTDALLMRTVDVLYGLPSMLLVVLLAVAVDGALMRLGIERTGAGTQAINVAVLVIAIGATSWLTVARVVRGQVLSLRAQPFMEAARAVGIGPWRQFSRHLLPNLVGPITVYAALAVPAAILSESFLSFLGLGIREPLPSWGNLAASGLNEVNTVRSRWWLPLWPCVLVAVALLSLNFVADAMRDRFDPMATRGRARA